ncbi:hypothetical protein CBM2592_A70064 [Cupriavidus taiwanensis]|nr:hypothetical protein CBM2588_A40219 [Cupriavidus taiwanensis]SOY55206.1 hypothetical protein CBM2592_A70064 [Cupriavidus taiwanensis]SOY89241.1 hypothetical protein CBM2591_A70065 [Cupriavidus taiwanensis]SOZ24853.1 hypothetical protein CBM2608_A50197 [Cupriavidus taiwanensis]SOZ61465.1 hypothetical protein CBM2617_A40190 [Cupriavidus taiwanensis]
MAPAWPSCCPRAACWRATSTWARTAADRRSRCRRRSSTRCSGRPSSASKTAPRPRRCRCSRGRSAGRYGAGAAPEAACPDVLWRSRGPAWRIRASGEFFSPAPVCVAIIRVLIRLRPRAPAALPATPGQRQVPRYAAPTDELDSGPPRAPAPGRPAFGFSPQGHLLHRAAAC